MKRRHFLGAAALGTAAAGLPGFLEKAFAQQRDPDDAAAIVADAYRRAALAGRPLFVIVVPSDERKYDRGHAWGELLNNGTDEQLWPFALVEVVAAPYSAVRRVIPSAPADEPVGLVVETLGPPRTTSMTLELPELDMGWDEPEGRADHQIDDRMSRLAGAVRGVIAAGAPALESRATQVGARLEAWESHRLEQVLGSRARLSADLARRGSAIVALAAERDPAVRTELRARLSAVAREDLVTRPVAGAHWASSWGCGTEIEGIPEDQQMVVGCGMGHVPERSQRFLYFFAVPRA